MTAFLSILSMVLALLQIGKEMAPVVSPIVQKPQLAYRYSDDQYAYYSDPSGRYWSRLDRNGFVQYAQNPNIIR